MPEPILRLRDVSLSFQGVQALSALSFDVARGEICALIGPNGAGKSSLLNVINGVYRADSGDIVFEDKRFERIRPLHAARLGIGRDRSETRKFARRAADVIAFLDLTRHSHAIVSTLPYGVQKRVDLARALVGRPTLLLLDEPMAGMNQDEKREMSRFILEANRTLGTTIVLIEHDIGVVMGLSHHVVVLDYGRKVGDGAPEEVRNNPDVIAAYLGPIH